MSLYELSGVSMTHDGRRILDVDHLGLEMGQAYSLQGPNGAGKSTLLGVLAFLTPPHAGEVRFAGKVVVWSESELRPLRRQVGLVEQHPIMFSRSVRDNVGFGLKLRGLTGLELSRRVEDALDLVGLTHLADAHAPRLSGGETQRVAIARALACGPRVLLLDEPTASVDTQNRAVIEQVVADMRDSRGMTIVLCTHNRSQAWALCPNVIYMEAGRVVSRALVNAFAGQFFEEDGQAWCRIATGFCMPVDTTLRGRGRVVVDPEQITLKPVDGPGLNRGPIFRIELEGEQVLVSVDLGRPLRVQVPFSKFRAQDLDVGALVEARFAASGIECSV
ncbi:MAG: ATP-binding cassette domain-containing protein [Deltaproteobacteria bacterium]|nr:ATP-binding cassette domain-containing protein [Deltaproteobacteria bacterium]